MQLDIVADASLEGAEIFLGDTTVVEGCNDAVFTVIRPDDTETRHYILKCIRYGNNGRRFQLYYSQ